MYLMFMLSSHHFHVLTLSSTVYVIHVTGTSSVIWSADVRNDLDGDLFGHHSTALSWYIDKRVTVSMKEKKTCLKKWGRQGDRETPFLSLSKA